MFLRSPLTLSWAVRAHVLKGSLVSLPLQRFEVDAASFPPFCLRAGQLTGDLQRLSSFHLVSARISLHGNHSSCVSKGEEGAGILCQATQEWLYNYYLVTPVLPCDFLTCSLFPVSWGLCLMFYSVLCAGGTHRLTRIVIFDVLSCSILEITCQ